MAISASSCVYERHNNRHHRHNIINNNSSSSSSSSSNNNHNTNNHNINKAGTGYRPRRLPRDMGAVNLGRTGSLAHLKR